ncbi:MULTISPECIES: hypothetical protein [unclassified Isoptericola]|uniref:hypothetical protein n=1 Tax=unclassified Isoptericola TaxID=2623355 RepID=UPI0036476408
MLSYRSYFTVDGQDVLDATRSQLFAWLKSKKYDADQVLPGTVSTIGAGVEAVLTEITEQDGSQSTLFQLREKNGSGGTWLTQVIAHQPGSRKHAAWLWVDIDSPDGRNAKVPRLARDLLGVLEARDGGARLSPRAHTIGADDVPALVAAIEDDDRRGPVFVAGSDESLPLQPWHRLASDLLKETTGIAAGYLLDPEATAEFSRRVGETHAVHPGTLRTFARGVDFGDEIDARRHRTLTTSRIVNDAGPRVVRILGQRARDVTLAQPLPTQALRVEERLLHQAEDDFLEQARVRRERPKRAVAPAGPAVDEVPTRTPSADMLRAELPVDVEPSTAPAAPSEVQDAGVAAALSVVLEEVFGSTSITVDAVLDLGRAAQEVASLRELRQRMRAESDALQARISELRDEVRESGRRLEDEQAEHAATTEALDESLALVQALRVRMQAHDQAKEAWEPLRVEEKPETAPDSFVDLLDMIDGLSHVCWTGDGDTAAGLDTQDPLGRWAKQAWKALQALDGYVAWRLDGNGGSVDHYLRNTPQGAPGFPAGRHAPDETDSVRSTAKYSEPRTLPVPATISPGRKVFMGAHFRIAQSGMTSPRLHYHDAIAVDEKIYVGYLGPHLPSRRTN